MRLVVVLAGVVLALAAATTSGAANPTITKDRAEAVFRANPKVARWLDRYPPGARITTARFRPTLNVWQVSVFEPEAGLIATGRVDLEGRVVQAWVGPEVGWPLARGHGVGGVVNRPLIWLSFCLVFFIGLANLRRPLCLRNLDLLALLSFSVHLWYFNEGRVFASVVAASVSFAYLIGRFAWIGWTNRTGPSAAALPVWLLVGATVLLVGFRAGLTLEKSVILDVGYAGVIGADRMVDGEAPYGNFPVQNTRRPCGRANEDGEIRDWIQANGRCESANPLGDTYGPVNYAAYVPGLELFGWSGKWDRLPAVRFTTILFDLLAILGLAAAGWRFGGTRLAALLAFAWAANPFTQYASSSNTNDVIMPALLIWGFWAASSDVGRGAFAALASWTKLAALIVVPLWATYPSVGSLRRPAVFAAAFGVVTAAAFWFLFAGGHPIAELQRFYERTFEIQFDRRSPFSLWDWGQYHASGLPDLKWAQHVLQILLAALALAVAFVPRRKTPLQLAALTAALLMGFEVALTHWSALYIVWFFPFYALGVVAAVELGGVVPEGAPITRRLQRERAVARPSTAA